MKITQSKEKDLMATLTVEVKLEDYAEKVEKVLKDYQKTAQMPGFRKGKTPMTMINKKYKKSIVFDEVNKLIQDELYKYITNKKINVLGSPLPIEQNDIDWENTKDFKFKYEIGVSPKFDVNITSKDKLNYFKIKADSKLVDNYCNDIAKRYGKMSNPEVSIEGDLIFCIINQLDLEGNIILNGINNEATVSMDHIADKKIKKEFIGITKGDIITLDVKKAFLNQTDLAAMLNVETSVISNLSSHDFSFTVKNINRIEPAKLNIELFDKVYGKGKIKTLKEFKNKVKLEVESQFVAESDRMLKNDIVIYFIDKFKLSLPNNFLKRWLVKTSKQPITMEILDKEYDLYSKSLQWKLIENKILENYKITVSEDDVIAHAKQLIAIQMKQYGQPEGDDNQLTNIANNILKNEEEKKKIYDQVFDLRTLTVYKEKFNLKEKSISYDDFVKLASEKS